ncbi:kinase-like domain-containing protein, partial [Gorgonomyces haynaldii]
PIGAGSFGEVYKARWHTTVVAVKRSHEKIRGKQIIDTIREEIDRWSKIHHPNVAEMIGACINTDKPFIVMRYYKNGNLAEYVLSHPELTILERHKWMYDIAAGLDAIHKVGMIHGDLKGDNILLDDLNTAVITDFGLSQLKKTGSSSSSAITNKKMTEAIRWIAPERYGRRFRLAPSYDIFAFGMTCYQILTGRVPFDEESNDQIVKEWIREGEVPDRPTNVPDYVWDLFERCIAKELSERVGMPEI